MICLDSDDFCEGKVELHTTDGTNYWARCEYHQELRVEREAEIRERYPYNAPSDFDSSYAGERWDDEY